MPWANTPSTFRIREFKAQVLEPDTPVLVDFQTTLCAPCRAIAPLLETLGEKYAGKLKIVKINCDDNTENAQTYGVHALSKLEARILNAL